MTLPELQAVDLSSIEAVIAELYASISFLPGDWPDWERNENLFLPTSQLIPPIVETDRQLNPMTIRDFIAWANGYLRRGRFLETGYCEKEVNRAVQQFGNIAQVFSVYEAGYLSTDLMPFKRGVNSLQLVFAEGRWWITSIIWAVATPQTPLPYSGFQLSE